MLLKVLKNLILPFYEADLKSALSLQKADLKTGSFFANVSVFDFKSL